MKGLMNTAETLTDAYTDINSCPPEETMVSLIYGEISPVAREALGSHLLICDACADEMAGLSLGRLDVYEWHRDEFVPLQTPRFVIPFEQPVSSWSTRWKQVLASMTAWARPPQLAAGLAAVALIAAGVWAVSMVAVRTTDNTELAASVERPVVIPSPEAMGARMDTPRPDITQKEGDDVGVARSTAATPASGAQRVGRASRSSVAKPVSSPAPSVKRRTTETTTLAVRKGDTQVRPAAPRLNDFDEEIDNSPRLGDLLADVDIGG